MTVTLAVAGTTTNVQVSGSSDIAELESSTLGGLVNERAIHALPLSSRNYTQILGLSPGVIADLPTATAGQWDAERGLQWSNADEQQYPVQRHRCEQPYTELSDDRGELVCRDCDSFAGHHPGVSRANCEFDAAYGRGTGANVDLVSKTGTNKFHGSAWEFVRNNLFNANDFFSKLSGQPRPDLKQNEFGAQLAARF